MEINKHTKNIKGTNIWILEKNVQEKRGNLIPYLKDSRQKGEKAFLFLGIMNN